MTFSLRRKRRTTARGRSTTAPKRASHLLALGAALLAGVAPAQGPAPAGRGVATQTAVSPTANPKPIPWVSDNLPAPPRAAVPIQQAALQQQAPDASLTGDDSAGDDLSKMQIFLDPPDPARLFNRRASESEWMEQMRQLARERAPAERIEFPVEPKLPSEPYVRRPLPPTTEVVEPAYVCHRRLYFEQRNFERGGWDLGFITPFVCAGTFFKDVIMFPYHLGTEPCRKYECNRGYCLPGDPVPFLLYPPELSATGALLEAGTIVSLFAIFPG